MTLVQEYTLFDAINDTILRAAMKWDFTGRAYLDIIMSNLWADDPPLGSRGCWRLG
jgi:hypothetical protein